MREFWYKWRLCKYAMKEYEDYQEWYLDKCRFHLDEYPEQIELRLNWFDVNHYFLYKNRFGKDSIILDGNKDWDLDNESFSMDLWVYIEPNPYAHFINRFNRRM